MGGAPLPGHRALDSVVPEEPERMVSELALGTRKRMDLCQLAGGRRPKAGGGRMTLEYIRMATKL